MMDCEDRACVQAHWGDCRYYNFSHFSRQNLYDNSPRDERTRLYRKVFLRPSFPQSGWVSILDVHYDWRLSLVVVRPGVGGRGKINSFHQQHTEAL